MARRDLLELQRLDLLGVGPHRPDRRDRVVDTVHRERRHRQLGQVGAEPVPGLVEFAGQRRAVGVDEGQRVVLQRVQVERVVGQPAGVEVERAVRVEHFGDRDQRGAGDDAGAVAVGLRPSSRNRVTTDTERMPLREQAAIPGRSPSASSVSVSARSELSSIEPKSPRVAGLSPWPNWSTAHRSMPAALSAKP